MKKWDGVDQAKQGQMYNFCWQNNTHGVCIIPTTQAPLENKRKTVI